MIQINLLPGGRKAKSRRTAPNLKAILAGSAARVKDPFLIAAVLGVLAGGGGVAWMFTSQRTAAADLAQRIEEAQRDSARFGAVIAERRRAEARRDSVKRTLQIIRAIDDDRYVWPHLLDEISRALPAYTWLRTVTQVSAAPTPTGAAPAAGAPKADSAEAAEPPPAIRFRIVGQTVDIQALTRFMKLLELSPFVQNVQLARSEVVNADGKEVTEFTLDGEFERPHPSALQTVPVTLLVR